jgi:hypothetical protein
VRKSTAVFIKPLIKAAFIMNKINNLSLIGQDEQKGSKFVACPTIITYDNKINAL